jgi:hypothetical protein
MFRVVGRDAEGRSRELSVAASTEEEARSIARNAGLIGVERVSVPPTVIPSRLPELSGFALGCLSSVICVALVIAGAVIGGLVARDSAPSPGEGEGAIRSIAPSLLIFRDLDHALHGAAVGAVIGLVCGAALLVACYQHIRERRNRA